ncbi:MAG: hypothetical protein R2568_05705 [Candidatus Scalindua sp.]|jgi:hypothetical protein|nr:hypothetical protein [Candidatus Scalindua sp.]MDV5166226.1 hypothetical protein [Candidatus Scalindua sp.]
MIYKKYNEQGHACGRNGGGVQDYRMVHAYCYKESLAMYLCNNLHNLFRSLHLNSGLQEQKIFEIDKYTGQ